MPDRKAKSLEDTRFRVLRLLQQNPHWSQRELAKAVGISHGSVHYLLSALVQKGLVKFGNCTASGDRRRYAYVLTPKGIMERDSLTRRFLVRKIAEHEALRAEIDTLREEIDPQSNKLSRKQPNHV